MKKHNCQFCENTGIEHIPNGTDDFDVQYCTHCVEGLRLERRDSMVKLEIKWEESVGTPDVFLIN